MPNLSKMVLRTTFWFNVALLGLISISDSKKIRVGIIGGGIGGTSTCFFLHQLLGNIEIDVYEPNEIGGRLATTQIGDLYYETGGSIIHEENQYVQDFMKHFNLSKKIDKKTNVPGKFGLYDGSQFLFKEAGYDWLTLAKLVYRYGPANFYRFQKAVEAMLKDFSHIYTLQKKKRSFATVESMLRAMNYRFVPQLKSCAQEGMKSVTSQLLLNELVSAGNLVNYGQSISNMPEFVTYVSCAGMSGKLFSINGGNKQLAMRLLKACPGNLLRRKVAKIVHQPETGTYIVHSVSEKNGDGKKNGAQKTREKEEKSNSEKLSSENTDFKDDSISREYDYVVVATPISLADIDFENMDDTLIRQQKRVKYHTTVTTLVQGQVNTTLTAGGINEILLTSPNASFFSSLSLLSSTSGDNSAQVYKIFSQRALESRELNQLFEAGKYEVTYRREWRAYPQYTCEAGFSEEEFFGEFFTSRNFESGIKGGIFESEKNGGKTESGKKEQWSVREMEDFVQRRASEMEDYVREKASDLEDILRSRAKERETFVREFFKGKKGDEEKSADSVWEILRTWEDSDRELTREWDIFVRGNMRQWEIYVRRNAREWDDWVRRNFTKRDEEDFELEDNVRDVNDRLDAPDIGDEKDTEDFRDKIESPILDSMRDVEGRLTVKTAEDKTEYGDPNYQDSYCATKSTKRKKDNFEHLNKEASDFEHENIMNSQPIRDNSGENEDSTCGNNGGVICDGNLNDDDCGRNSDCGKNKYGGNENCAKSDPNIDSCDKPEENSAKSDDNIAKSANSKAKSVENSFLLNKGLYYINVIELAASAMEMSAIGAHNVALLISEQIRERER